MQGHPFACSSLHLEICCTAAWRCTTETLRARQARALNVVFLHHPGVPLRPCATVQEHNPPRIQRMRQRITLRLRPGSAGSRSPSQRQLGRRISLLGTAIAARSCLEGFVVPGQPPTPAFCSWSSTLNHDLGSGRSRQKVRADSHRVQIRSTLAPWPGAGKPLTLRKCGGPDTIRTYDLCLRRAGVSSTCTVPHGAGLISSPVSRCK